MADAIRIVSLVPGATDALVALGLSAAVVGRSHECDAPAVAGAPVLTWADELPSAGDAVDARVRDAAAGGRPLSGLDQAALRAARPDLVIAQGLCGVCAVEAGAAEEALAGTSAQVLALSPATLGEVLADVARIGAAAGAPAAGAALRHRLEDRLAAVADRVSGQPARRTVCLEWLDPPYRTGHWIPDMVAAAGGEDPLGAVGARACAVDLDQVAAAAPDVLVLAPCGLGVDEACREADRAGLRAALAARGCRPAAVAVDSGRLLSRPGPGLVDGVEVLAALLHPDGASRPDPRDGAPAWGAGRPALTVAG